MSATQPMTIAPNDSNIAYSPYNWSVGSGSAQTINAGAYFRALIQNATSISLEFDMTNVSSPYPLIKYRVDDGPMTTATLAASVSLPIPSENSWPAHLIEVVVQSTSAFVNRWDSPSNAMVSLTGILCAGANVATRPIESAPLNILVFGDSITEGYQSLEELTTPDGSDASVGWAYLPGRELGAEVGVVGFSGQGWTAGGRGNVPVFPTSYIQQFGSGLRATSNHLRRTR